MVSSILDVGLEGTDGDVSRQVIPPQGFRLGPNSKIRITARGTVTITLTIRFQVYAGGRYLNGSLSLDVPSDRSQATAAQGISGVLVSASIRTNLTTFAARAVHAQVTIERDGILAGVLTSGYVEVANQPCWPPGFERSPLEGPGAISTVSLGDPAAGADYATVTVPTGARWKVRTFHGQLVTSAVAAARAPVIRFNDSAGNWLGGASIGDWQQPTARTVDYVAGFQTEVLGTTNSIGSGDVVAISLPDTYLTAGSTISFVTTNKDVGDNWGPGFMQVEEFLDP